MPSELDVFRNVVPFVAVAEEKSFRRAAARLEVSPAAVSKAIQALEAEVDQPLLARTTRSVSLTPQGEAFFERCQLALTSVRAGRDFLASAKKDPAGVLTLSVPFLAVPLLTPALRLLAERYPALEFDVRVSDQLSRLAEESIDVAVRIGTLAASSLVAKRLRRTRVLTVASPAYLGKHGTPRRRADLAGHRCLVVRAPNNKPRPFLLASGPCEVKATMVVDHGPTLVDGALAGLGVAQAFDFMLDDHLRSGRLVEVLADEAAAGPDIHAVCAAGRRAAPNVRAAFDALVRSLEGRS
ncbi:MAG: LysR family transcriptional regulator [Myxococcota bacterium]